MIHNQRQYFHHKKTEETVNDESNILISKLQFYFMFNGLLNVTWKMKWTENIPI